MESKHNINDILTSLVVVQTGWAGKELTLNKLLKLLKGGDDIPYVEDVPTVLLRYGFLTLHNHYFIFTSKLLTGAIVKTMLEDLEELRTSGNKHKSTPLNTPAVLSDISDKALVEELRRRGYKVKAIKCI